MKYPIPESALTQHIAVLGKTGSGKTTAIRAGVETILDAGGRVCIVDPTGAWWGVWAPEVGLLERVAFPRIRTFDSSAAPTHHDVGDGPVLASIDKDSILSKLKTHADEAQANDPAELKKRIRELEKQLTTKPADQSSITEAQFLREIQVARDAGFNDGANHGYRCGWQEHRAALSAAIASLPADPPVLGQRIAAPPQNPVRSGLTPSRPAVAAPRAEPNRNRADGARARQIGGGAAVDLPKGEAAVLAACIQFPDGLRREQLTVLSGYKRSSRDAYIQRLREKGFVDTSGDRVTATEAGCDAMPDAQPLPTGEELRDYWLARLPEGERKILTELIAAYPDPVSRDALSDQTGYMRSSRDAYLQRMRSKQLVEDMGRGQVRASENLF